MGILVLADGLFRIQLAVDAREFGISQWWLLLGCAMFSEGILNLCVALCTTRVAASLSEK